MLVGRVEDTNIVEFPDPHLVLPTLDGNIHVLPVSVIQDIVSEKMSITDVDDGELIMRSILDEWLNMVKEKV